MASRPVQRSLRRTTLPDIDGSIMQQASPGDRYVDFANHCLRLAATTTDEESRLMLREMASRWLELAEAALAGLAVDGRSVKVG